MGKVKIKIVGGNQQYFFNIIKKNNIKIYKTSVIDGRNMTAVLCSIDYDSISRKLNQYYDIIILRHYGKKNILKIASASMGFILGGTITIMLILYTSCFIWKIDIYGNDVTETAVILQALEDCGVSVGSMFDFDTNKLASDLLLQSDTLAEVSIERKGSTLLVNVSELLFFAETEYQSILAPYDGIVTDIQHSVGTLNVGVGDVVQQGDVLVQSVIYTYYGEKVSVHPISNITISAVVTTSYTQYANYRDIVYTGQSVIEKGIYLGNICINQKNVSKSFEYFDKIVYTKIISDTILPLYMIVTEYREVEIVEYTTTLEECYIDIATSQKESLQQALAYQDIVYNASSIDMGDMYIITTTATFDVIVQ